MAIRALLLLLLLSMPLRAQEPAGHVLFIDGQTELVPDGWSRVVAKRPELAGAAFTGPISKKWTPLAVKALDKLPPEKAQGAAKELSSVLETGVLHLALTKDGRAWYFYWDEGKLVDKYCSNPGQVGEVPIEVVREWQGRPELLLPVCRGTPLSKNRSEVSITDFNGFLYSYYPEMKASKPASWRTATDVMELLAQVVGVTQLPAPFHSLIATPGWKRL